MSGTVSTVVFRPCEIIRTCDARANAPQKRRLKIGRERKSKSRNTSDIEASVMNDVSSRKYNQSFRDLLKFRAAHESQKLPHKLSQIICLWIEFLLLFKGVSAALKVFG